MKTKLNTKKIQGENMTKENKRKGTTMYKELKQTMGNFYKVINNSVKDFKKNNKKEYKNLLKNVETNFTQNIFYQMMNVIFGVDESSLLSEVLGYVFDTSSGLNIISNYKINYEKISEDKSFMIFYTKLYIYTQIVERNSKEDFVIRKIFNIRSSILMYFFIYENKITETKILNLLSFFFKNSTIILNEKDRTEENEEKIRLITTGVKYTKEKTTPLSTNNTSVVHKSKSKNFDLLQHLSTRITIKYISKQEHNRKFRKRPIIHYRRGYYKFYKKSGKTVWVRETIVNKDVNNTNEIRRVS